MTTSFKYETHLLGLSSTNTKRYDAQGLEQPLDYCRWVGNGGCRKEPSFWSYYLWGHTEQKTKRGEYFEPNRG